MELLQALKRVRKDKEDPLDFAGGMSGSANPMAQMASMMGTRPSSSSARAQPAAMNGSNASVGNMTEDQYVKVWEEYSQRMGTPFDASTVRGWYRQHKQMNARK